MTNETTLIFENVKKIRQLLKEDVSQSKIEKAINNREILHIYYAGDDTVRRGFRTVEPYVLGTIKKKEGSGDLALRAWQQAGASDTFKNPIGRWAKDPPREDHEYFKDPNVQPGWRLFKLKGITYALPTGKHFLEKKGPRPLYKGANDKGLNVITYAEPKSAVGSTQVDGADSITKPDDVERKVSAFDTQKSVWKDVVNQDEAEMLQNLVALYEKVKTFDKDATRYYDLTFKDGIYRAVRNNSKDRFKYTDNEVVGNLEDLYNKYSESDFEDMNFFKNQLTRGKVADKKG